MADRDTIKRIFETSKDPLNALWAWAREPEDPKRRADRWEALAEWAGKQRLKAKPKSKERRKWAEAAVIYDAKAKQNRKQAQDETPELVGWDDTDLVIGATGSGALGPETKVTTHYAASPRAENLDRGIELAQSFNAYHRSLGWGGLSYHYLIPDSGEIILGRAVTQMGYHVANTNTGNVGINFFATLGDQPTEKQAKTYLWLLANAHTEKLPAAHRTDRDLRQADIRGHKFWGGQSTSCPGFYTPDNLKKIAAE